MSDEALLASITEKLESAGLDASTDEMDVVQEEGYEEIANDADVTPDADTPDADPVPVMDNTEGVTPDAEATGEPVTPEQVATLPERQDAEDDLAEALGLGKPPDDPKQRAKWWKRQLPYSLIHKTVSEREKKLKETHEGVIKEHTTRFSQFDARNKDVAVVEEIITKEPERYIRQLAAIFPETYGKMFAPIISGGKVEPLPATSDTPLERPAPNVKLPDGTMTYDLDGIDKLSEYIMAATEQKMLKTFKPHLDFVDTERKTRAAETRKQEGIQTAQQLTDEVKTWDLGAENIDAILEEAARLPESMDAEKALLRAYNTIVIPKLKVNRDAMRAELLKEQKAAAAKKTATAIAATPAIRTKEASQAGSLDDRIMAAIKRKGMTI